MSQAEIAKEAIKHALRSLRKRHKLEERAHAPAFIALSRPFLSHGSEWKEKVENLELELQQCYKAQARLSEQLVVEVAESRASNSTIQEKEALVTGLQNELTQARDECSRLSTLLEEKTKALDIMMSEHHEIKKQLEAATLKAEKLEAENKMLVDRWMEQKRLDAECLNEANAMNEDLQNQAKSTSIQQLARQQVDGVVRQFEEGAEFYVEITVPNTCKRRIPTAHEGGGGCAVVAFEHNAPKLFSGGNQEVKMWEAKTGAVVSNFRGLGTLADLSLTLDNRILIAACGNNLFVWNVISGKEVHVLTGHENKVCTVDASKVSSRHAVSASHDRTIKLWDLNRGYRMETIPFYSMCNALSLSMDGEVVFAGHTDGQIRLWDFRNNSKDPANQVEAHSGAVTSLCLSRNGNMLLTSGRDNVHRLFDIRTLEVCGTFRVGGNRVGSISGRACLSPDENYIVEGSLDGSVYVWSASSGRIVGTLKEHTSQILCCSWSDLGRPLATSDKAGTICLWT